MYFPINLFNQYRVNGVKTRGENSWYAGDAIDWDYIEPEAETELVYHSLAEIKD